MSSILAALRRPSPTNEPPSAREVRRNGILVILMVAIGLFLGWQLKEYAQNNSREVSLGGQLPSIAYPANWIAGQEEGYIVQAVNPKSASTFDARLTVYSRDLRPDEDLDSLSASWPLSRSQALEKYRNLSNEVVVGPQGAPALLITYAYIADPTRDTGAVGLPIVVQAQDLLFVGNDGANDRFVVITTAADASDWETESEAFERIYGHLGVKGGTQ